eukprot:PLAT1438.1.p1 GENE.PLAT1438.1~~PLAT1438.1.p1  ORF type:complete len:715 (+),score=348.86 PLAT1438.1:54-2147(+)
MAAAADCIDISSRLITPADPSKPAGWGFSTDLTVEQVTSTVTDGIAACKAVEDAVVAVEGERTWENTVAPLLFAHSKLSTSAGGATFLQHVSTDSELRDASSAADEVLDKFWVESGMRKDVYDAVAAYDAARTEAGVALGDEEERALAHMLRDFRRNGLALDAEARAELEAVQKRERELCVAFSKALGEEKTLLPFTAEQLDGMDDDFLSGLQRDDEGRYLVSLKYPVYFPIMKLCRVAATRQACEAAFQSRCMGENAARLEEAAKLRARRAQLLGYDTYSDFRLEVMMSGKADRVRSFLDDLLRQLKPRGESDLARLAELKAEDAGAADDSDVISSYDFRYYLDRMLVKDYAVDHEEIKKYFPLNTVLNGMFDIYQSMLGLRFEELDVDSWHPEVRTFRVDQRAEDGAAAGTVGYMMLDLHPREGKYGHAACFTLQRAGEKEDGSRQPPVAAMVCNFTKPTAGHDSLLKHSEVVTLFHEFGHVAHALCSLPRLPTFGGISNERDFVEAPSQMLEFWCWTKEALALMSGHVETGEKLPDETVDALVRAKYAGAGVLYLRQLFFGTFDMTLHGSVDSAAAALADELDSAELYNRLRTEVTLVPAQEGTNGSASFGHLMGGYESLYYGYLWSEVYAADMFSVFRDGGDILDPALGARYRSAILQPGGSKDSMDLLRDFLGREPKPDAFLSQLGLEVSSS